MKQKRRKIMVKITSKSWVEKDDPMFTGRFYVHSVRPKDSVQKNKKTDRVKTTKEYKSKKE
jgi:hypothetical protein